MIRRKAEPYLKRLALDYPAVAITGPRQSGKTTLARLVFDDRPYVSLENPDEREFAESDPRGFLQRYRAGAVFDEVQRCPALFSYLQQVIDEGPRQCRFVLTGSQQFGLMSEITQSLAGRIASLTLLPFSYEEWYSGQMNEDQTLEHVLFQGLYPPILDRSLEPSTWYRNYVQNYVERDLRQIAQIGDLRLFGIFLRMCAARSGSLLNLSALASDCGIAVNTAKNWISILEASYIVFLLHPHHSNFGKRLIKTPKLYFYDPGLLSYLLSIDSDEALAIHSMRGHVFETHVVSELKKAIENEGRMDRMFFWRDRTGHEVDIVVERAEGLIGVECKSGRTVASDWFKPLLQWSELARGQTMQLSLVYGGDQHFARQGVETYSWRQTPAAIGTT